MKIVEYVIGLGFLHKAIHLELKVLPDAYHTAPLPYF